MKYGAGLSSLVIALALAACAAPESASPGKPDRIILVSMDTVRGDIAGGHAGALATPTLREIAAEGVTFTRFYAASSYTIPSHASIFTGLDPVEHGVTLDAARIGPEVPTLAELLSEAGYRTQAFHEGVYVDGRFGFDRGFDAYLGQPRNGVIGDSLPRILSWIRTAGDEPFFLFLHTYAAHYPYGGFGRYRAAHPERGLPSDDEVDALRARYTPRPGGRPPISQDRSLLCTLFNHLVQFRAQMLPCGSRYFPDSFVTSPHFELDRVALQTSYTRRIAMIDTALKGIQRLLVRLGRWEGTLLIVTSDHGEAFFEHGLGRHDYIPFDEVLRVPLVVSYPRLLRDGAVRRIDGPAWHLDLMPTVLAMAGVPFPGRPRGMDLGPVMRGGGAIPSDRAVFPLVLSAPKRHPRPPRRVAYSAGRKMIEGHPRFGDERGLLFDVDEDPGERRNLRATDAEEFEALAARADRYEGRLEPRPPVHQQTGLPIDLEAEAPGLVRPLEPEMREQLRELGYLD